MVCLRAFNGAQPERVETTGTICHRLPAHSRQCNDLAMSTINIEPARGSACCRKASSCQPRGDRAGAAQARRAREREDGAGRHALTRASRACSAPPTATGLNRYCGARTIFWFFAGHPSTQTSIIAGRRLAQRRSEPRCRYAWTSCRSRRRAYGVRQRGMVVGPFADVKALGAAIVRWCRTKAWMRWSFAAHVGVVDLDTMSASVPEQ